MYILLFKLFHQFVCFENLEMRPKEMIAKIRVACLSPMLAVHMSNGIISLLQQYNVA